ncbi:class IIb bacteriocin, lactobin A/cerein 7B family [Scytonema sp. NUACC26]
MNEEELEAVAGGVTPTAALWGGVAGGVGALTGGIAVATANITKK